jgi:4'-phosphopantetheinyl transferase
MTPRPAPQSADIFVSLVRVGPAVPDETLARVLATLPPERRERLRRFRHAADVERGALADASARLLIAERTGTPVHEIVLERDGRGAPVVAGDGPAAALGVSLTHAGRWVACALSRQPTGVDVEVVRRLSTTALGGMLSDTAVRAVLAEALPNRFRRAVQLWTAIEAYLKCLGVGLGVDPREVRLEESGDDRVRAWISGRVPAEVELTDLGDQHVLAVCGPGDSAARRVDTTCTTSTDLTGRYLAAVGIPRRFATHTRGVTA